MREIIKAFDARKKTFGGDVPQVNFYVPKGKLWDLNIAGKLEKGNLTITKSVDLSCDVAPQLINLSEDMKSMFDPCVDCVVTLIQGQIAQVRMKKYRVRVSIFGVWCEKITANQYFQNVFLVGGFGESPYLQEELKKSLKLRNITMRKPDLARA
jgi:hypothetical protein